MIGYLVRAHLDTLLPHYFRFVREPQYTRKELATDDGDFLDLDWVRHGRKKLVIGCHGLEGSSRSYYMKGIANALVSEGSADFLAWNFRSCGGQINRQPTFYHSGLSSDLAMVVDHVLQTTDYAQIYLIGFSMGGNVLLKYLGETGAQVSPRIQAAFAVSVPIDLRSSAYKMAKGFSRVYSWHLISSLKKKVAQKIQQYRPDQFDFKKIAKTKDFIGFDNLFTAPLHGFKDNEDYWARASSKPYLRNIRVPTILMNALNDPFLGPECFPIDADTYQCVKVVTPKRGGHVGFPLPDGQCLVDQMLLQLLHQA